MKYLLLLFLCLPLFYKLGIEASRLVGRELAYSALRDDTPAADLDVKRKAAEGAATAYGKLNRLVLTLNEEAEEWPGAERDLVAAEKKYAGSLGDARSAIVGLRLNRPAEQLPEAYKEWLSALKDPEDKLRLLEEALGRINPNMANSARGLPDQIKDCSSKWEVVAKRPYGQSKVNAVRAFLVDTTKLVELAGKKIDEDDLALLDDDFKALNHHAANAKLQVFANKLAILWAKKHYLSQVSLSSQVRIKLPGEDWKDHPSADVFKWDDGKADVPTYKDDPELQFKERAFFGNGIASFIEADFSNKGFMGRLKPTDKSVIGRAYNRTCADLSKTGDIAKIRTRLFDEYRVSVRDEKQKKKAQSEGPGFAIAELQRHYPAEGAKVESLLKILDECDHLFR